MENNRTKIVVIAKCEDCPVTCCENRLPCGLIPDTCQLEDAQKRPAPSLRAYVCNECHTDYEQILLWEPHCPVCGSINITNKAKGA